jgi:hypothetical protein
MSPTRNAIEGEHYLTPTAIGVFSGTAIEVTARVPERDNRAHATFSDKIWE